MKSVTTNIQALYVHFPFCAHLCHYCDFAKLLDHGPSRAGFLATLRRELQDAPIGKLTTLYWGGGTPTVHPSEELREIGWWMNPLLAPTYEWTVEVNPETVDEEKLRTLYEIGVNRLSIGVQTTHRHLLDTLGRHHQPEDVQRVIATAHRIGFTNISVDLMIGLPSQTLDDVVSSLATILALGVTHLSVYALTIEPHTPFYLQGVQAGDDDLVRAMYDAVEQRLETIGWEHYEVSNFAASREYRSRHNLVYWTYQPYWAIGPGAHGFTGTQRYENKRNFTRYFQGDIRQEWTTLSRDDQEFEYIMLGLRLKDGLSLDDYQQRFGTSLTEKYQEPIERLIAQGQLILTNSHLKVTKNGMMVLHPIILAMTAVLDEGDAHASS